MDYQRTNPKVSIVIPSWFKEGQDGKYGKDETYWMAQKCLNLMIKRTPRELYELIIIDNGSTLMTKDLSAYIATVEWYWGQANILIKNKKNLGFGPACNQGFAVASGEYIVCVNNDIIVWPGWLDALINVFQQDLAPPAGVVMTALMKETSDFNEALKVEMPDLKQNYGKWGHGAEFGSLWMMPKAIMDELKKQDGYIFDENFKLGMGEDRDLWDRVRLLGFETYRCHETRVFHQGNMTIGKVPNRKDFTFPNREYLAEKRKKRI